jgi:hypothetical protein
MNTSKRKRSDRMITEAKHARRSVKRGQCSRCLRKDTKLDKHGHCTDRETCELIAPPLFQAP